MKEPLTIENLRRVDYRPGDKFVVTTDDHITEGDAQRIRELIEKWLGGNPPPRVIVLGGGMKLSVIREEAA